MTFYARLSHCSVPVSFTNQLARVVRKVDNAIDWINHCPADGVVFLHLSTG